MFFLKLRERAGTESMMCGLTSLMATGTFFNVARGLAPTGTVAMLLQ